MEKKEKILRPVGRIHGGTLLPHLKGTAESETVIMPPPKIVKIPMLQHIGAPAEPVVAVGDKVCVGTLIGKAGGFVSAPVHSSVSGTVSAIGTENANGRSVTYVTIESDGEQTPPTVENREQFLQAVRNSGSIGLGGAGFPTSLKLGFDPKEKQPDFLIINGAECEPYITSDYRECIENYNDVIEGVYLLKEKLGVEKVIICIESNKEKAITKLYTIAADKRDTDDTVKLMKLPTSYPQGAEKVIIYSATGRKVPLGKLPSDVGCIVMNITSVAALYRFITTGVPLVSKRITVDGTAVKEPKNVLVPIGTTIKDVLEFAGGVSDMAAEIMMGGPMMGIDVCSTDAVIEKRNNAIIVMEERTAPDTTPCIHCDRCAGACPMRLYPANVEAALDSKLYDRLDDLNVNYCMECGSCAFVCPAHRPLTQSMRLAKAELRRRTAK